MNLAWIQIHLMLLFGCQIVATSSSVNTSTTLHNLALENGRYIIKFYDDPNFNQDDIIVLMKNIMRFTDIEEQEFVQRLKFDHLDRYNFITAHLTEVLYK